LLVFICFYWFLLVSVLSFCSFLLTLLFVFVRLHSFFFGVYWLLYDVIGFSCFLLVFYWSFGRFVVRFICWFCCYFCLLPYDIEFFLHVPFSVLSHFSASVIQTWTTTLWDRCIILLYSDCFIAFYSFFVGWC